MAHKLDDPYPERVYARLAPRLQRIVGHNVRAPDCLIEDACQIAWSRWVAHRDEVAPGSTLGWLSTTATREAVRLLRQQARYVSLEGEVEQGGTVVGFPARAPGPEQVAEFRDRLAEVRQLPTRQQRAVWLQSFGYGYQEIAARTGSSRRSVERTLLKARRRLHERPSGPARP